MTKIFFGTGYGKISDLGWPILPFQTPLGITTYIYTFTSIERGIQLNPVNTLHSEELCSTQ
jgi:hypothetical protein